MAERSFAKEVKSLRLGDGDTFKGEGILAITKALLQSGVAYVGGYQGSPVSHMMDVLADAHDILGELGVHFEVNGSEATAAAMLSASISYPLRGCVTWKSTVGTNVAADALANLASSGVTGGTVVVLGEDYGEGASIMQERSHAFAMKSQMWLLDPRPNLTSMTAMLEQAFDLSEASSTPVFFMMRIRACHVTGEFQTKNNRKPQFSARHLLEKPNRELQKIVLPPLVFAQEKQKIEQRWPAAVEFIKREQLNETFAGSADDVGVILQGGLYNTTIRALERLGLSDCYGNSVIPLYVLNVTYPLIAAEITRFCAGKQHVLVLEEGQPDFIEQALHSVLRKADLQTRLHGKGLLPMAGEYSGQVVLDGVAGFIAASKPSRVDSGAVAALHQQQSTTIDTESAAALSENVPARPAGLCTGCPERPLFSAITQVAKERGPFHISADIGCHSFATLPPFDIGNTIMGYGLSLASSSALRKSLPHRSISIMGDGGFWHNGLTSGVASAVFNHHDGLLILVKNGYSAATGGQALPSFVNPDNLIASSEPRPDDQPIVESLRGVGVKWIRTVSTYNIEHMIDTLQEALTTKQGGLKVIVAEGECMLNKQRRIKPQQKQLIQAGKRTVKERFVVDSDTCTGDHACIRLSGCPSLTITDNPDPLKVDPVAHVDNSCVGCGVCGSNAHAAILCPSFVRAELIFNPNRWDTFIGAIRQRVIGFLQRRIEREWAETVL